MVRPQESRPALVSGLEWASRISMIAAEFVVPVLIGFFIDKRFGSTPLMVLIGVSVGFVLGIYQTIRLADPMTGTGATGLSGAGNREHDKQP